MAPTPESFYMRDNPADKYASTSYMTNVQFIVVFDFIYILGTTLLLVVLLTAYISPSVRRRPTWYMLLMAWDLIGISNLMLLGKQTGPEPGADLCLVQAVLEYALPNLAISAGVAFIIDGYLILSQASKSLPMDENSKKENILLLGVPLTILIASILEVLIIGLANRNTVVRHLVSGMYCNITDPLPRRITAGVCICGVIIVYMFIALIFNLFRRRPRDVRPMGQTLKPVPAFGLSLFIRMIIFSTLALIIVGISFSSWVESNQEEISTAAQLSILEAILPFLVVISFGTQRDIIRSLSFRNLFRRKWHQHHTDIQLHWDYQ